jgi:anti-anti-sigma regulatory factor
MPESASSVYLVDAYSDPVVIRIEGRACFQNSASLRDFVGEMLRQGRQRFIVDFQKCTTMDSTFLGVLAGVALELRKGTPSGSIVLARVGARNLELIRNLGLHRLLTVDAGEAALNFGKCETALSSGPDRGELDRAKLVLESHEHLVAADEGNRTKFQDVLAFLKSRVDQS